MRAERALLLAERDGLSADDWERIEEILRETPGELAAIRSIKGTGE
ncbi:hypothetical protein [Streptomyces sp. NBC_00525]|nr:hypothetical protein [Streptomyces sp. NBC_00525]WUC93827.1 hypothetical protein OG710_09520 [Streptomyces sp. NBC_00525]